MLIVFVKNSALTLSFISFRNKPLMLVHGFSGIDQKNLEADAMKLDNIDVVKVSVFFLSDEYFRKFFNCMLFSCHVCVSEWIYTL